MNILEEARYRLTCCRAKTGDGWGEPLSLRHHLDCRVQRRLHELKPFVDEINGLPETHEFRPDATDLMYEYHDLLNIQFEIRNFINPPLVEVIREPKQHALHPYATPADLSSLVRLVDTGDFIHCTREAYRGLDTNTLFQASINKITFVFPEPPSYIENGVRKSAL